jgi:hypothetical protein
MVYVDIKEGDGDGTTTDDYVVALSIDVRARRLCTIHLLNSHAANGLKYKVLGYATKGGVIPSTEVSEATVAGTAAVQIVTTKKLATIELSVKSAVGATPATYDYEYIATVM